MQSFVFSQMNKASREKDPSYIQYYGPLASALGFIIHCGNLTKNDINDKRKITTVYRGLKVSQEELDEKYKLNGIINLSGFTSSTLDRDIACSFAFGNLKIKDECHPCSVLFEIEFTGHNQFISLYNEELSSFPNEREVLL